MSEVAEPTPAQPTPEPTPTPAQPAEPEPQQTPEEDDNTSDDDDQSEDDDDAERELAERLTGEPQTHERQEEKEGLDSERSDESETEREASFTLPAPPRTVHTEHTSETHTAEDEPRSFEDLMNDDELTRDSLQVELNKYAQAIKEEYELTTAQSDDLTRVEEHTRDFFKKNVHSAAAQIVWLANNAESESVKLKAATTVIHEALADSRADGDPIKNLLSELTRQPTDPSPTS